MTKEEAIARLQADLGWHHSDGNRKAHEMGIQALERTRWIPCSERLPENHKAVLATWKDTWYQNAKENIDILFREENERWYGNFGNLERNGSAEVIAWMPLPEPYRGK